MDIPAIALSSIESASAAPRGPERPEGLTEAALRFSALMEAEAPPAATQALALPGTDVLVPPPVEGQTLGDAILGSMRQISTDFSHKWTQVQSLVEQDVTSIRDLLRMQVGLTQVAIQYEMVGKAISKSTQNFDQLVRLQ